MTPTISTKPITKQELEKLFEEQQAVFTQLVSEGVKYRPRADFFVGTAKIATLIYPNFESFDHMCTAFDQASWFPKIIRSDESILFLDVECDVISKKNGEVVQSDVFLCLKVSNTNLMYHAAPYYINPEVKYPTWNDDYELTEANVFSLTDIISSLYVSVSKANNPLDSQVVFNYLEDNGFELDFHFPWNKNVFEAIEKQSL